MASGRGEQKRSVVALGAGQRALRSASEGTAEGGGGARRLSADKSPRHAHAATRGLYTYLNRMTGTHDLDCGTDERTAAGHSCDQTR